MQESLFAKIIKGEIPCHKIYEDDEVLAFLDIYPIQPGHALVIPKQQVDHLDDLNDRIYIHLFKVVKLLSQRVKGILRVERACLAVQGFDIAHAHVHISPCNQAVDFYNIPDRSKEPDHQALSDMASKLAIKQGKNE